MIIIAAPEKKSGGALSGQVRDAPWYTLIISH